MKGTVTVDVNKISILEENKEVFCLGGGGGFHFRWCLCPLNAQSMYLRHEV